MEPTASDVTRAVACPASSSMRAASSAYSNFAIRTVCAPVHFAGERANEMVLRHGSEAEFKRCCEDLCRYHSSKQISATSNTPDVLSVKIIMQGLFAD